MLVEAGITTPYDIGTLYVAEQYATQAEVIQNDLSLMGITSKIEILEFNAYIQKLMGGECGLTVLQMSLEGVTQQYELAFGTKYIGGANNQRYSNADVDKMFEDAVKAVDETERFTIYNNIFKKVGEDAVYVNLYNPLKLYAFSENLNTPEFPLEGKYNIYEFSWS